MIQKPTTLVLGAGASAPFGFPTGYGLLQKVLAWADVREGKTNPVLFRCLGHTQEEIDEFREALRRSGKSSVDAFLEHRPEFIPVGKAAMAMALISYENEAALFKRDGASWYEYLFNQLNATFEEFDKNRLSILTFNYDRSLEHYLFTALTSSYGKLSDKCVEKLNAIPIVHLHGDLGKLPFTGGPLTRAYSTEVNESVMRVATQRIKIIHEGIEGDRQFARAQEILGESKAICFLGFGYHPINLRRLGFTNSLRYQNANIYGSSLGFTSAERRQISLLLQGRLSGNHPNADVLQFLRESAILHSGG
jgi:hypothetical protein